MIRKWVSKPKRFEVTYFYLKMFTDSFLTGPYALSADPCATCYLSLDCPGHMGHIELSMLVYNPIFIKIVTDILRVSCMNCFKLQLSENLMRVVDLQLRLVDAGYISQALDIEIYKSDVLGVNASQGEDRKLDEYEELLNKGSFVG